MPVLYSSSSATDCHWAVWRCNSISIGRDLLFWSLILPHGIIEITAILIGGAAGMLIGKALIAPGQLSRSDALKRAGSDAIRLLLGTIPLFIVAGFTESFITPSALPAYVKLAYAALTAVGLAVYFRAGKAAGSPANLPMVN